MLLVVVYWLSTGEYSTIHSTTELDAPDPAGLSEFPAVALLNPSQVGKTSLARLLTSEWEGPTTVFDLEEYAARAALSATPDRLLRRRQGLVVLDEVHRLPRLFEVLLPICDDPAQGCVFLLLGSASLKLHRGLSESLAGRVRFLDVAALSLAEVGPESHDKLWIRGGFRRAFLALSSASWGRWMESFGRTFVERDIPSIAPCVPPET